MGIPLTRRDRHWTYADLCALPEDERWEIIDGVAWNMSPAPIEPHQWISGEIWYRLRDLLGADGPCRVYAAPFDVFFPRAPLPTEDGEPVLGGVDTVVQPDVVVICDRNRIIREGCIGAPDLVVEILSPSTSQKDLREKFALYERGGVREYWVVDPGNEAIALYRLGTNGRYADPEFYRLIQEPDIRAESRVVEGFSVSARELFSRS